MKFKHFIALSLLSLFCSTFATASPERQMNKEYAASAIISTEVKEAYKVDDAEYSVGLFSKDNLGTSLGVGSEGIALLGGIALLASIFKRSAVPLLGAIGLLSMYFDNSGLALAVFPLIPLMRDPGVGEGGGGSLSQEQLNDLMAKVSNKVGETITKEIEKANKGKIDALEFKKTLEEAGIEKGIIKKLENVLKTQGEELTALKAKAKSRNKFPGKSIINEAFTNEEFIESIQSVAASKSGKSIEAWKEPVNKVNPTTVTTGNITTDTGGNALFDMLNADEIDGLNLQEAFIEDYCSVSRTSRAAFIYADPLPLNGDAGFTAENAPKSQMDVDWQVKTIGPKKVTGYEVMSEEAVTDIPQMQSVANTLLLKKVMLKRQNGILFGNGVGANPLGVSNIASPFDPASWSDNAPDKVVSPNLYDAIIAGANMIQNKYNYVDENEYYPNLVLVNPKDFAALKLKKNEFGMYLFPQFVIGPNKDQVIDNLTIVSRRQIPAGKIFIGDFTKLRIINYVDYNLRMGYINDQLINNLFTMVGESRFFTVVKQLDKIAFVYDDIQNIYNGIQAA